MTCVFCGRDCPPNLHIKRIRDGGTKFSRRHWTGAALADYRRRKAERLAAQEAGIIDRANERARRSPADQLKVLDRRLGSDIGARKERARLKALLVDESK